MYTSTHRLLSVFLMTAFLLSALWPMRPSVVQAADTDWFDDAWSGRVKLSIDPTHVDGDLSSFPVYVDLSDMPTAFHDQVRADGCDIRVVESDGVTETPFELVSYNSTDDSGELHFLADAISASTANEFYIYYGNTDASCYAVDAEFGAENTWPDSYKAVYHLSESGVSLAHDSTSYSNHLTPNASVPSATGKVANGRDIETEEDNWLYKTSPTGLSAGSDYSITGWVNPESMSNTQRFLTVWNNGPNQNYLSFNHMLLSSGVRIFLRNGSAESIKNLSYPFSNGTWYKVTFVYDASVGAVKVYVNGLSIGTTTGNLTTYNNPIGALTLGDHDSNTGGTLNTGDGVYDEHRLNLTLISDAWEAAEYQNQSDPSNFYTIGTAETSERSLGEYVDGIWAVISTLTDKATKNSYTASLKNVLSFYENDQLQAAWQQLNALLKKVGIDSAQGGVDTDAAQEILDDAASAQELIDQVIEDTATVSSVPLITQIASPYPPESSTWANMTYADGRADYPGSCGATIRQCGCALSSFAMVGQAYGLTHGVDGSEAIPPNIDAWLLANNGYTSTGEINWDVAIKYFGDPVKANSTYFRYDATENVAAVKARLVQNEPVIIKTKATNRDGSQFTHFVVGTEYKVGEYSVNDPLWFNTKILNDIRDREPWVQDYNDFVSGGRLFEYQEVAQLVSRVLEVRLASPAELLLVDQRGRKLGKDTVSGEEYSEIPGGQYFVDEAVYSDELAESGIVPHQTKVLRLSEPTDDVYSLQVIGTDTGNYTLSVLTIDNAGGHELGEVAEVTTPNQVDTYIIDAPVDTSSSQAVMRLRELADAKEALQPTVAERLRAIAMRLETENVAAADAAIAVELLE